MSAGIKVATIGFTQTTAQQFFERLSGSGIKKVIDVRLHNTSQLAGFAKAHDLAYFLKEIGGIEYTHQPLLAPTDNILKAYKKKKSDWGMYEDRFFSLMAERQIENHLTPNMFADACLLCSEAKPHHCHRRLVCEYLNRKWDDLLIIHHL